MNYEKNGDLRSGKSAVKTVKGFTVIELLIVIAIIAILAGMTSLAIAGFVTNTTIETSNSKAQQAYASLQNMLIDLEIRNKSTYVDSGYITSATGTPSATAPVQISIQYYMEVGELDVDTLKLGTVSGAVTGYIDYKDHTGKKHADEAVKFIKRAIEDSIDSGFTGYVYADIDLENYIVESIVYSEDSSTCKDAVSGTDNYIDVYETDDATPKLIRGIGDITDQKSDHKLSGDYLGFYPFMNDVGYTLKTPKTPRPANS